NPSETPKPGANPLCMHKGLPVMCGPRGLLGGTNLLYRNLGGGKFKDVSQGSGFSKPSGYFGLSVLTGDFNNDGWPDVYIACDSTPSILFSNNHDGTFTDIGVSSGTAFNQDGQEQAGMGAAAADFNHDGLLDIAKTNFADDVPTLYQNKGNGFFTDVTQRAGLAVHNRFLGWGLGFIDVDNDGWKDILMVNGHIYPSIDKLKLSSPYRQEKNLYWNLKNGAFADISTTSGPAILARHSARGAAFGDLNNDGSMEVVVNNMDDAPSLLVDRARKGNWLLVGLRAAKGNPSAIGARVTVKAGGFEQMDEVRSGGSYLSNNDKRLHFGLGAAAGADWIEVRWPSGATERFAGTPGNRVILLKEGQR
ncbi:MAG: CRTAC1 family protein, partial [Bryobacteraceae bacterium]